MKTVIGLVGEKGSGKETFVKALKKLFPQKKIAHVRFSDILSDTLKIWDLPLTRENLQDLAIIMNKHFGEGTLTQAVKYRVKTMNADIVVLDGVRWDSDVNLVRSFPKNYLIYITADLKTRFERIKIRKEKAFEEGTTLKQFMHEEQKLTELQIPKIGKSADFKIENNGNIEDMKKKVEKIVKSLSNKS